VRAEYLDIAAREPERVRVIDAHADAATVAALLHAELRPFLVGRG
jgi:thymidylate kinase